MIDYKVDTDISVDQFADVLKRSGLSERRPIEDRVCMDGMLRHADLVATAWKKSMLIGIARSVTDFNYCCYLSDLAVDRSFHHTGIGRELIRRTREQLGPQGRLFLLAAPAVTGYYPHIGFTRHDSAWVLYPADRLE